MVGREMVIGFLVVGIIFVAAGGGVGHPRKLSTEEMKNIRGSCSLEACNKTNQCNNLGDCISVWEAYSYNFTPGSYKVVGFSLWPGDYDTYTYTCWRWEYTDTECQNWDGLGPYADGRSACTPK